MVLIGGVVVVEPLLVDFIPLLWPLVLWHQHPGLRSGHGRLGVGHGGVGLLTLVAGKARDEVAHLGCSHCRRAGGQLFKHGPLPVLVNDVVALIDNSSLVIMKLRFQFRMFHMT